MNYKLGLVTLMPRHIQINIGEGILLKWNILKLRKLINKQIYLLLGKLNQVTCDNYEIHACYH
jgi:hypothetical protein